MRRFGIEPGELRTWSRSSVLLLCSVLQGRGPVSASEAEVYLAGAKNDAGAEELDRFVEGKLDGDVILYTG